MFGSRSAHSYGMRGDESGESNVSCDSRESSKSCVNHVSCDSRESSDESGKKS